jgi:hypothetical protein
MNLLWLQSGGCGGCTLSWLGSEHGSLFRELAAEGIELLWHPSLSGERRRRGVDRAVRRRPYLVDVLYRGVCRAGPLGSGGPPLRRAQPMIDWV